MLPFATAEIQKNKVYQGLRFYSPRNHSKRKGILVKYWSPFLRLWTVYGQVGFESLFSHDHLLSSMRKISAGYMRISPIY